MLLKNFLFAATFVVCVFGIPIQQAQSHVDKVLQSQVLISVSEGRFKDLIPMLGHFVVYTGAVLPSIKAAKEHKHTNELTESILIQTMSDAAKQPQISELEKMIPSGQSIIDAMVAIGNVLGSSSGYNPVKMMSNVVGEKEMASMVDEIMHFPLRFPDPTDAQIEAAEQVVLAIGLGFGDQERAIDHFMKSLSKEQEDMIESLEKNVIEKTLNAMVTPNGDPSPALIEEIKRQMREMEKRTGSTEMMPKEFQDAVQDATVRKAEIQQNLLSISSSAQTVSEVNSLSSVEADSVRKLLPAVNEALVIDLAVLPTIRAHKEHKQVFQLGVEEFGQAVAEASGRQDIYSALDPYNTLLDGMIAFGDTVKDSEGANPVNSAVQIVGRPQMLSLVTELTQIMTSFPDTNDQQLEAANAVVNAAGSEQQIEAVTKFIETLNPEQTDSIAQLQKRVNEVLADSLKDHVIPVASVIAEEAAKPEVQIDSLAATPASAVVDDKTLGQALLAVQAMKKPKITFANFIPMINQVTVYSGVILPSLRAKKDHMSARELSETSLMQTLSEVTRTTPNSHENENAPVSDLEKYLPTSNDMLDAMIKIGKVVSGESGFNPVEMMTNVVGEGEMKTIIDDIMHFPLRFPELNDAQIMAAEEAALKVGLGFGTQEEALQNFISALDKTQQEMISTIEKDIIDKLIGSMVLPNGEPSEKLVEEIKHQIRLVKEKTGSTDSVPDEFKSLISEAETNPRLEAQTLLAVEDNSAPKFKNLFPLVRQACVLTGIVLPSVQAKKSHKHNHELNDYTLIQTIASAGGVEPSDLEKSLPSAEDLLNAMIAVGNVIGGSSGFNPVQMMTNLVGKDHMIESIHELMVFPLRFPDLTDKQFEVAEEVILSLGLGFTTQEEAIEKFISSLDNEQQRMLTHMQHNVIDRIVQSMVTPNGDPSPQLIAEIQRTMKEMEVRKGSTEMMPQELKDLVSQNQK